MLDFVFPEIRQVLLLGAHSDDIEIGCGGTVLRLASRFPGAEFHWVTFSSPGERAREARRSAEQFLASSANKNINIHDFRDGFFPHVGDKIKETFEDYKRDLDPQVIMTHHREDLHQDHRTIAELTWNTFRDHFIMEYEILKYDGMTGSPNVFVALSDDERRRKLDLLEAGFPSQRSKDWFDPSAFDAIMRLRGVESRSPSGYAEAFYCRKVRLG